jgi:hypothetical protein
LWKPATVWAAILAGALALGVAGALVFRQSSPPPAAAPFDEIEQSATVTSEGITIEALGASYSGTETILRFRVTVEDEGMVLDTIGEPGPIRRVVLSGNGYSGPFDGRPLTSTPNNVGELLVHAPPLKVAEDYNGSVALNISEVRVHLDQGTKALPGQWVLPLEGPSVSEAEDQLRVEALQASEAALAGGSATIAAVRSRSETRVSVTLPAGALMLSQPLLEVDGERLSPRSFNAENGRVVASFAATAFGEPAVLHFGAIASADGQGTAAFAIALDELLARIGEDRTFDVPPEIVTEGPGNLVARGEQGEYGPRPWFGLVLRGNWHPENGQPVVTDAAGTPLDLAHVQVGYEKDANGNILEGTTGIGFFVDGDVDLSRVTLVLGRQSAIDRSSYSAPLIPTEE